MSGPDTKAMERRLLKMQADFNYAPNPEQRVEYVRLWLEWCDAKGLRPKLSDVVLDRALQGSGVQGVQMGL